MFQKLSEKKERVVHCKVEQTNFWRISMESVFIVDVYKNLIRSYVNVLQRFLRVLQK